MSVQYVFAMQYTAISTLLLSAIIKLLVDSGARVKEKNLSGWTPLDEAISYGQRETSESTALHHSALLADPTCLQLTCSTVHV